MNMFIDKKQALRCAEQAAAAREVAIWRSRRQLKRAKSEKTPYKFGTLGLSTVSKAIKDQFGFILPRQQRKLIAKKMGVDFQPVRG